MKIIPNFSLKNYNTFGIDAAAKEFVSVSKLEELQQILKEHKNIFVLGGGSNMLLTRDIDNLVVHVNLKGKEIVWENESYVHLKAQAGESWHELVLFCVENNYGGVENLSFIPGNTGTTPIQNIGAYGTEIKDVFISCEALNIETLQTEVFAKEQCEFGYRESVFKGRLKGKYIITSVTLQLTKNNHKINIAYGDIARELAKNNITSPTIKDVSNAVTYIRKSKLPDPKELGNSGSFFKNPVISITEFEKIKHKYPEMPHYIISDNEVKIPAGWLIEQAGFKGKRFGSAGVHKNQALVLVNYGDATGQEILDVSKNIQKVILEKFNIKIEAEVNII